MAFQTIVGIFFLALAFSLLALPFAALPAGAVALTLNARDSRWEIQIGNVGRGIKIRYVILCLLGGVGGELSAINALFWGEWWICKTQNQLCHDGQGGLMLVFTVPVFSLLGSILALIWTWISLRIPKDLPWASIFRYSGPNRLYNWTCAIGIQVVLWLLFFAFAFLLTKATLI